MNNSELNKLKTVKLSFKLTDFITLLSSYKTHRKNLHETLKQKVGVMILVYTKDVGTNPDSLTLYSVHSTFKFIYGKESINVIESMNTPTYFVLALTTNVVDPLLQKLKTIKTKTNCLIHLYPDKVSCMNNRLCSDSDKFYESFNLSLSRNEDTTEHVLLSNIGSLPITDVTLDFIYPCFME